MDERLQSVETRFDRLETGVQTILSILQTLQVPAAAAAAANNNAPAPVVPPVVPAAAAAVREEEAGKFFDSCIVIINYFTNTTSILFTAPPLPRQVGDVLRATPRLPAFDTRMPRRFVLLLAEWQNRGLEEFRNIVFHDSSPLTQAYGKRKYLVDYIGKQRGLGQTLQQSAAALDANLGTHTLTFRLRALQAADQTIVRRVKRRRVVVGAPDDDSEATPPRRPPPPPPRRNRQPAGRQPGRQHRRYPLVANRGITIDGVPRAQWVPNATRGRWEATAITAPGRLTGYGGDFA